LAVPGHSPRSTDRRVANLLAMTAPHSSTVRARRLGLYLRKLRESHGRDYAYVAALLGVHHTTVRRIEKGATKPEPEMVEELLGIYGVDPTERLGLLDLAKNAWRRGWWQEYGFLDDLFVSLEDESSVIRSWQPQLIPGILQGEDYARALFLTAKPQPTLAEVDQRVDARIKRQALLRRHNAPNLHAVLGEAALRQQVGGTQATNRQFDHLLQVADRDNVTLQVLPFAAGAHTGLSGPFTVLEFAHADDPDVVYTEDLSGHVYSESETALTRFRLAWGDVIDAALDPDHSVAMIAALVSER